MKAYSLDLRQRVLSAALRGDRTIPAVAGLFGVSAAFVNKMLRLHRAGADLAPRSHGGGYPARLLPRHEKLLRSEVRRRKDSTLEELRAHLEERDGVAVSVSTVSRALIRLDLGRKKKSGGERAE
jgi:transposase